jgi:hypothetical protein
MYALIFFYGGGEVDVFKSSCCISHVFSGHLRKMGINGQVSLEVLGIGQIRIYLGAPTNTVTVEVASGTTRQENWDERSQAKFTTTLGHSRGPGPISPTELGPW